MSPGPPMIVKNCSEIKPLCLFTEFLDVKNKTDVCQVGADKSKRKSIRAGIMLCSSITKMKGHAKINEQVNKYLYNCILKHSQVFQSPIGNDFLKVSIDYHSEPQLVSKLLLQVYIRKFITAWLFPQNIVDLSRQEIYTIK